MKDESDDERAARLAYSKAHYVANKPAYTAQGRARYAANRDVEKARAREYYAADPERRRRQKMKCIYGLSEAALAALESAHKSGCAICGSPGGLFPRGGKRGLCIDHDHETGQVRGMLCSPCNKAVGLMKDSPLRLRRAAAYLDRHAPALLVGRKASA